jgi:hypothetical protein
MTFTGRTQRIVIYRIGLVLLGSLSLFLLLLLFSVRPMRLNYDLTAYGRKPVELKPKAEELIKAEHQKAIEEIKLRIEQEDTWFHYKFVLVGGLIVFFSGYLGFGGKGSNPEKNLEKISQSSAVCVVLALACVIAFSIDMHIRNNTTVIQQLALWIENFVEPAYLQTEVRNDPTGFLPWEQFLRKEGAVQGMHRDDLYGFIFYPHLHYITLFLYILFLWVFQNFYFRQSANESGKPLIARARDKLKAQKRTAMSAFVLVHATLLAFTLIGHTAPSAFDFKIFPWSERWADGRTCTVIYSGFWLVLLVSNIFFFYLLGIQIRLRRSSPPEARPVRSESVR